MWEKAKEGRRDGKLLVNVHTLCSKVFWTLFLVGVHVSQIILSHPVLIPSIIFPLTSTDFVPPMCQAPSEDLHNMSTQMSHRHCQLITPNTKTEGLLSPSSHALVWMITAIGHPKAQAKHPPVSLTPLVPLIPHPTHDQVGKHSSIAFKSPLFSTCSFKLPSSLTQITMTDSDGSSYLLSPVSIPHWAWKLTTSTPVTRTSWGISPPLQR